MSTSIFFFFRNTTCDHVFDHGETTPSEISCKVPRFRNGVQITSLEGILTHVLTASQYREPMCVV
jgi:hypothetical protein